MPSYKLVYFDLRGRGEFIRMMLHYKNIAFEDEQITLDKWPEVKNNYSNKQLPVFYVDGKELTQSMAIAQYLGDEHGLSGQNNWQRARCLMLGGIVDDLYKSLVSTLVSLIRDKDKPKALENFEVFLKDNWPHYSKLMEKYLEEGGGQYFVSNQITWFDFLVADLHEKLDNFKGESIMKETPKLKVHYEHIRSLPRVKEFLEKRAPQPF